MKKLLSKNLVVGLLLVSNISTGAYILNEKTNIQTEIKSLVQQYLGDTQPTRVTAVKLKKKAYVQPVSPLKNNNEIQACYEAFLLREPMVDEGKALFHWTLSTEGNIVTIDLVNSDFEDAEFTDCIIGRVQDMVFPNQHPEGTVIAHTFRFKRKDQGHMNFANK